MGHDAAGGAGSLRSAADHRDVLDEQDIVPGDIRGRLPAVQRVPGEWQLVRNIHASSACMYAAHANAVHDAVEAGAC